MAYHDNISWTYILQLPDIVSRIEILAAAPSNLSIQSS